MAPIVTQTTGPVRSAAAPSHSSTSTTSPLTAAQHQHLPRSAAPASLRAAAAPRPMLRSGRRLAAAACLITSLRPASAAGICLGPPSARAAAAAACHTHVPGAWSPVGRAVELTASWLVGHVGTGATSALRAASPACQHASQATGPPLRPWPPPPAPCAGRRLVGGASSLGPAAAQPQHARSLRCFSAVLDAGSSAMAAVATEAELQELPDVGWGVQGGAGEGGVRLRAGASGVHWTGLGASCSLERVAMGHWDGNGRMRRALLHALRAGVVFGVGWGGVCSLDKWPAGRPQGMATWWVLNDCGKRHAAPRIARRATSTCMHPTCLVTRPIPTRLQPSHHPPNHT